MIREGKFAFAALQKVRKLFANYLLKLLFLLLLLNIGFAFEQRIFGFFKFYEFAIGDNIQIIQLGLGFKIAQCPDRRFNLDFPQAIHLLLQFAALLGRHGLIQIEDILLCFQAQQTSYFQQRVYHCQLRFYFVEVRSVHIYLFIV